MKGEPIKGPHWIEVDLGASQCAVERALVDWETAHATVRQRRTQEGHSLISRRPHSCQVPNPASAQAYVLALSIYICAELAHALRASCPRTS